LTALRAAGYAVYAVNPRQVARYRERRGTSGAKSDKADAHTMTDMVRTDARQLRPVAGDSPEAEAIKVAARARQTLIWERTRQVQRLRHQLREYFPGRAGWPSRSWMRLMRWTCWPGLPARPGPPG
jgi:transposase